jgi:hypothetical protein
MRRIFLIPLLLISLALRAAAQDGLAARNEAFLRTVRSGDRDAAAAFFPRRGEWTWVQALRDAPAGQPPSIRRFAAADARAAIGERGPACWSFQRGNGAVGPPETYLGMQAEMHGTRWRRVRGNRFVPPGQSAASPVFVEWRREDGRWVLSSFGDVDHYGGPHVAGVPTYLVRDTASPLPPMPVYVTGEPWFVNNEYYVFEGRVYLKYGRPRPIDPALLHRVGRRGMVGVYAERGAPGPYGVVLVLYFPTAPGEFQPYPIAEAPLSCG